MQRKRETKDEETKIVKWVVKIVRGSDGLVLAVGGGSRRLQLLAYEKVRWYG